MKKNGKSMYCSAECKAEATRRRQKQWREEHPDYHKRYFEEHPEAKEKFLEAHPNYARDRSRRIRGTVEEIRTCVVCGKPFKTTRPWTVTCSNECRQVLRREGKSNRLRKMVANGKIDSSITLDALIKRDKGICYLCGKEIDRNDFESCGKAKRYGSNYPSIDHVVPISKGGTHTWDNVKLAHMLCNARKGNKTYGR